MCCAPGLTSAAWITVDDTGARHKAANGFCTQIGNDISPGSAPPSRKSRLNFLDLLRAGHADYVINDAALAYMRGRALAGPVIAPLGRASRSALCRRGAWQAHLDRLGITALKVTPDPVLIATEGALWGSVKAHGFLPDTVIVSDDAGQFDVGRHALCWVHAERLVHKLDTFTDQHAPPSSGPGADLVVLCAISRPTAKTRHPAQGRLAGAVRSHLQRRTGFVTLDRLLARLHANKPELLMVLDRPEIPLHTNGSENDIRCQVTKRKISSKRWLSGGKCRGVNLTLLTDIPIKPASGRPHGRRRKMPVVKHRARRPSNYDRRGGC